MREYGPPPPYRAYPFGIVRQDERFALDRDGAVVLLAGRVTAEDGDTYVHTFLTYALKEPLPRALLLQKGLLLQAIQSSRAPGRIRRGLLLSRQGTDPQEVWMYLEPAGLWVVVDDPAWISQNVTTFTA